MNLRDFRFPLDEGHFVENNRGEGCRDFLLFVWVGWFHVWLICFLSGLLFLLCCAVVHVDVSVVAVLVLVIT